MAAREAVAVGQETPETSLNPKGVQETIETQAAETHSSRLEATQPATDSKTETNPREIA